MENKKNWAEIRNDHDEEMENGFHAITIDAWKTGDDDEEGKVIAKVFGKWVAGEAHIFFDWRDALVLYDEEALAAIEEAKVKLIDILKPINE